MAEGIKTFFTTSSNFNDNGKNELYLRFVSTRYWISIPSYIGIDYADYEIGHGNYDGTSFASLPEFSKYNYEKSGAEKSTFSNFPEIIKFFILANSQVGGVGSSGTITPDDQDYEELISIFTFINNNFSNYKNTIVRKLRKVFKYLTDKAETGTLTPSEVDFFKLYSKLVPDLKETKLLRIAVIKQDGDSDYIFQNFGIEGSYSLDSFSDRVTQIIQNIIDTGGVVNFDFMPEEVKKKSSGDWLFKYLGESWFTFNSLGGGVTLAAGSSSGLAAGVAGVATAGIATVAAGVGLAVGAGIAVGNYLNNNTGYIEVPIKMETSRKAGLSFARLYAKTLNLEELKNSEIYDRPTNLDEIFWSNGPGQSNSFFENDPVTVFSPEDEDGVQDSRTIFLADVYDPSIEKNKIPFFDGTKGTGTDDVTFCYYLTFIDFIRFDVENNTKLNQSIGYYFEEVAKQAADYIFKRLKTVYENTLRTIIAVTLSEKEEEILEGKVTDNELLLAAEEEAKRNLQNINTSSIISEDLSDEDIADREKKYKQCVLLLNLPTLKEDYNKEVTERLLKDKMHNSGLYNKRFTMIEDRSSPSDQNSVINKLIIPKAEVIRPFLNMTNELYASLVPKIRLHKVYFDPSEGKKNPYITREIPFNSHTSTKRVEILNKASTFDKGDGCGIKSFNFSFDGETPATSTKFIKAKLELYFQTFADFAKEREVVLEDGDSYKFRYVDLFVNTKFCPRMGANEGANTNSPLHYDPSHYRIRADVGWEMPSSATHGLLNRPGVVEGIQEVRDALEKTNKSFYLNLIDHDISIGNDGTVTISADYIAYIEGAMGTRIMNALLSREARQFEQDQIKQYEDLLASNSCDENQLSELRASIQAARVIGKQKMYQSLTEKLILNGCLYSCFVDKFDRKRFSREQFFLKVPQLKKIDQQKASNANQTVQKVKSEIPDTKTQEERWSAITSTHLAETDPSLGTKINFFYFADLVYFLLDSLYVDDHSTEFFPEVENIKVILTSFALKLLGENNELLVNIGQIPVDLDTFIEWYKGEILDKDIEAISVIDFIKRFFLYLVKDIFQEVCVNTGQHKRLSFKTMSIMANGKTESGIQDPLQLVLESALSNNGDNPVLNVSKFYMNGTLPLKSSSKETNIEASEFYNYMTIFVHYRPDKFTGLGVKHDDETKGIYHFFVGADKGLVKKVNFSKSDIQYIRESRMMNQGTNNLLQLSSVYRCNLTMIGNTLLYPGMEIFVNPFGFGGPEFGQPNDGPGTVNVPNLSNIMGIGGYQQVVKVNSTISPGKFETTIDAIFVHSGEKQVETSSSSPRGFTPNRNRLKDICAIDSKAIDTPQQENNVIDCNETIKGVQNALLKYSKSGTIDKQEEES